MPDPRDRRGPPGPGRPAGPGALPWGGSGEPGVPAPLVFPPGRGISFTIGRTQECDLRIADMSVSRLHAQLTRTEDGWLLSDLGSHNGTRVNGWLVREPVPVRVGDVIQFGSATFVVKGDVMREPQGELKPPEDRGEPGYPADPGGSSPQDQPDPGAPPPPKGIWNDGPPEDRGEPGYPSDPGGLSPPRGIWADGPPEDRGEPGNPGDPGGSSPQG